MMTLWDLLKQVVSPAPAAKPAAAPPRSARRPRPASEASVAAPNKSAGEKPVSGRRRAGVGRGGEPRLTMEEKYEAIARAYLEEHGIKVRKWRTAMSGIATQVRYKDGRIARYIESPRPKGPMSMAVFLHEIGHHAIGFNTYKPRCLEEYHAWRFAIERMEGHGLNVTEGVKRRMHNSLRYAVQKAARRGIKHVPAELHPYLEPWRGAPSGRKRSSGGRR